MVLGLRLDLALVEGWGLVGMVRVGRWEMFCVLRKIFVVIFTLT